MKNQRKSVLRFAIFLLSLTFILPAEAQSNQQKLSFIIELIDQGLPSVAGEGITWNKATYKDGYIVFNYDSKETEFTIDDLNQYQDLFKQTFLEAFVSDMKSEPEFLKLLKEIKPGMKLEFKGSKTNKNIVLTITPQEFQKAL